MDGTVTGIGAEAGDSYQGGNLVEISDCTNLRVSTSVDEYDISDVAKGQKVVILTDATGDEDLSEGLQIMSPTDDTSSSTKTESSSGGLDSLMRGGSGNKGSCGDFSKSSGGAPSGAPGGMPGM